MNILHKFLINVIYYFKVVTKILSNKHDYKIQTKCIEYYVDHDKSKKTDDPFWKKEIKYSKELFSLHLFLQEPQFFLLKLCLF